MSAAALVDRRSRIARVRRLQHVLATGAVAEADARVATLAGSAARLVDLRAVLLDSGGAATGGMLAGAHELAGRLETAREGLADAIVAAQAHALERDRQRIEARRDQEAAAKLQARAEAARDERAERRAPMPRRRRTDGGDEA